MGQGRVPELPTTCLPLQMRTNAEGFIAVIDVAAARFLEEMDYVQEMANAKRFEEEMCAVEFVRGMIKVPKVWLGLGPPPMGWDFSCRHWSPSPG